MMKRFVIFLLLFLFLLSAAAAKGKGFFAGIRAGGMPLVWSYYGGTFGMEVGYLFGPHFAIIVDGFYGAMTLENSFTAYESRTTEKEDYICWPTTLSVVYIAPVSEKLSLHFGAGGGIYPISIKRISKLAIDNALDTFQSSQRVTGMSAQACMALEYHLSPRLSLLGNVRCIFGKKAWNKDVSNRDWSADVAYGGTGLTIGLRHIFE